MNDTVFRTLSAPPEPSVEPTPPVVLTDAGNRDVALTGDEIKQESPLDMWELQNGKYGAEYLGIKEISKQFPYNAQFSILDKYIKSELEERGYDKTPEHWQDVLAEIEGEIQTSKLNAIDRLKKLSNYVRILQKLNAVKKMKEQFR